MAEHLLAAWVAQEAGLALPEGRATVALPPAGTPAADVVDAMGWAVPWGRSAAHVVRIAPGSTALEVELWPVVGAAVTPGANVAGEPRDTMRWPQASRLAMGPVADVSLPVRLHRWVALVRNARRSRAGQRPALTIAHVTSRQQFGRPIGAFQAVRNLAAVMAGEVAVASAAQRAATRPLDAGLEPDAFAVAAAKLRGAMAATRVAAIAHELHGAIGTTREHRLHLFTRRLWAAPTRVAPRPSGRTSWGRWPGRPARTGSGRCSPTPARTPRRARRRPRSPLTGQGPRRTVVRVTEPSFRITEQTRGWG